MGNAFILALLTDYKETTSCSLENLKNTMQQQALFQPLQPVEAHH